MPNLTTVSTKLQRIATLARQIREEPLHSLSHHIDLDWLREAWRRTRKDSAVGVDGQTAQEYEQDLEANLQSLLDRAKTGQYWAPPVRRVQIPKGRDKTRPIGIPTLEDKLLQRAVLMALEPVWEQEFLPCSYGFRPGRSAHQALEDLWRGTMAWEGGWLLEVDVQSFFDTLGRSRLREMLRRRVRDGVLLRLIGKWLNAGVLEEGAIWHPRAGTPQGGVISSLLANIYLHEVLDTWLANEVAPTLRSPVLLYRYADDFVLLFRCEADARQVQELLWKRFEQYGLKLHPEKTRLIEFRRPPHTQAERSKVSFDFLGFTHFWARSRKGRWVIQRKTASKSKTRALAQIHQWCRRHRHDPVREQHHDLSAKLQGHYGYFGITGNARALARFRREVERIWRMWLDRRGGKRRMSWSRFRRLLAYYSLPPPRIVHSTLRAQRTLA
jgi:group II intron reverse transcriptase/maturase